MRSAVKQTFEDYLTVREAADMLGVSPWTLRNWDKSGKLKPSRHPINGYRIYRPEDLQAVLSAAEDAAEPAGHFVQFYNDPVVLIDAVDEFFGPALERGEATLMVSTPEHRDAIEKKLSARNLPLGDLEDSGQYRWLDAQETLNKFMDKDAPDPVRCREVVGELITTLKERFPKVRVFGEMVALLCDRDQYEAAVQLEQLWCDLAKEHSFSLLCAYPLQAFAGKDKSEVFGQICDIHGKVIPTEDFSKLKGHEERMRVVSRLQQQSTMVDEDAAHQRQAEELSALLAAIVTSSDDAIISKSLEGRILSWNKGAERVFGYTAAEAIGQPITMIIPSERLPEETHILSRLRRGERIEHFETVRQRKDGRAVDISLTISPVHDSSGRIIGVSKVARDISEQKALQRLLRESEERYRQERTKVEDTLIEADRRKDEFLATLAHELRNPLAPINNAVYILGSAQAGNAMKQEALQLMQRQVIQMKRLVDDLMDISRITRGRIELQKSRIYLNDAVQSAIETARPFLTEKKHALIVLQPPEPIEMEGDAVRLSQVFANLLNNASKYTDEGGRIELSVTREGDDALVRVRDNGIGIPREMLPVVFDMFVQVDNAIERSHGGLGIGLTLVKELVLLHGGRVEVLSEGIGKGAEFVVHLPITHRTAVEQPEEALTPAAAGAGFRVLVVDDNRASAKTLAWPLELMGHEVEMIHDGAQVMEKARSFKPEVVLLDIGLPGTNGYDLCRQLREDPDTKDAFIIAQTGWGQAEHRKRSKEAGFDQHLVKPVEIALIEHLLNTHAEQRSKTKK